LTAAGLKPDEFEILQGEAAAEQRFAFKDRISYARLDAVGRAWVRGQLSERALSPSEWLEVAGLTATQRDLFLAVRPRGGEFDALLLQLRKVELDEQAGRARSLGEDPRCSECNAVQLVDLATLPGGGLHRFFSMAAGDYGAWGQVSLADRIAIAELSDGDFEHFVFMHTTEAAGGGASSFEGLDLQGYLEVARMKPHEFEAMSELIRDHGAALALGIVREHRCLEKVTSWRVFRQDVHDVMTAELLQNFPLSDKVRVLELFATSHTWVMTRVRFNQMLQGMPDTAAIEDILRWPTFSGTEMELVREMTEEDRHLRDVFDHLHSADAGPGEQEFIVALRQMHPASYREQLVYAEAVLREFVDIPFANFHVMEWIAHGFIVLAALALPLGWYFGTIFGVVHAVALQDC
jgi:hypothetical protein